MLIIYLNNGKLITTDLDFNTLKNELENANYSYVRFSRKTDDNLDVECCVDKSAIDMIDIIENN